MSRKKKKGTSIASLRSPETKRETWYQRKRSILWFSAKFVFFTAFFHALFYLPTLNQAQDYLADIDARIASLFLNWFHENCHVAQGVILYSTNYAITILPACTDLRGTFFFGGALMAFPAPFWRKIIGVLIGALALLTLNLIRITVLFLVGVHFTSFFDSLHEEIWGLFSLPFTIYLLIVWIKWAKQHDLVEIPATA